METMNNETVNPEPSILNNVTSCQRSLNPHSLRLKHENSTPSLGLGFGGSGVWEFKGFGLGGFGFRCLVV